MPLHLAVGRNRHDVEVVDLPEFVGFGHGRAGHAADLLVELEEVLQGDRGQGLRLFLDLDPFFGLDGLVQAVAPLAAFHFAAGELIDDDDRAVLDDVVHVALVEVVGLEGVVDQVRPLHVAGRVEALDARQPFRLAHAFVGEIDGVVLLVDDEVLLFLERAGDAVGFGVLGRVVVRRTGDDQRRAGFVDEDVVDLVDDGEIPRPLRLLQVPRIAAVAERRGRMLSRR